MTPAASATWSSASKYRFVEETKTRPQIGVFPMFELPTGNSARGLGNGGHSIAGETHTAGYLGLYHTWGHHAAGAPAAFRVSGAPTSVSR